MATEIRMARLSPTMETGTVNRWLKKEGDAVSSGDTLAEVETDKASMPLEAFEDGVLLKILAPEGATVKVDELVAIIGKKGEDVSVSGSAGILPAPAPGSAGISPAPGGTAFQAVNVHGQDARATNEGRQDACAPRGGLEARAPSGRIKASPIAKKIAAERGIDLHSVAPSGPGGRIIERDISAAVAQVVKSVLPQAPPPLGRGDADTPLTNLRQTIAKRLLQSKQTLPHWYCFNEVLMDHAVQFREDLNSALEAGGLKISLNDLIIKVCAVALAQHPEVNASFNQTAIRRHGEINIAVAVATADGLYTPVLRQADKLSLSAIAAQVKALAQKAREKQLKPEDLAGSGFTISNLGMFGVDHFFAIINPPEAAILAVGAVKRQPVVNAEGQVVAGSVMGLSLSCDHRVIDGALGAKFLGTIKALLEHPAKLLRLDD